MRNILLAAGFVGLFGLVQACGNSSKPPAFTEGGTSPGGTSAGGKGSGGKSSGGTNPQSDGGAGDDADNSLAPDVHITSPTPVSDPNGDGVLVDGTVTVVCTATQSTKSGSAKVNASSVKLAMLGPDGSVLAMHAGAPTGNANEYSFDFALTEVQSGLVTFTCSAESADKQTGSDEVSTLVDNGPVITFTKPVLNAAYPLSQPLEIDFTVTAAPLTDGDDNAAVDSVALNIVGQDIPLDDAEVEPGHYQLQVNLADPKLFMPPPSGPTPVTVTATNKRSPKPRQATVNQQISVDGAGPTIKFTSPLDKAVVGGKVKLIFDIGDLVSGVDPSKVVVALNKVDHPFDSNNDAWTHLKDTFTFEFDSRQIKDAKMQITVNVRADDKVGNPAVPASELLYLDNYPPSIDLDPSPIRTFDSNKKCSGTFDPVGDKAANDLGSAIRSALFRAVVWDNTNEDPDNIIIPHFSATNQKSVRLYLEGDNAKPLIVDTDNDGYCDDVAQVDSTNSLEFGPIPKAGVPWLVNDPNAEPKATSLNCTVEDGTKPPTLCTNNRSEMWQVIQDEYNNIPVIYGASPTPNSDECTGVGWEFTTKIVADGWVCFATRAADNVGNVSVSRPLRICVDSDGVPGTPACATASMDPPTCTDGCIPQPRWGGDGHLWK